MSFSLFLGAVIVFWIYIYYQRSKSLRNDHPLLPLTAGFTVSNGSEGSRSLWRASFGDSTVNIEVAGFLLLRISTNLFVKKSRRVEDGGLTSRDRSRPTRTHSKYLTAFYNFGSFLAIVGQFFIIGALWWSAVLLLQRCYRFLVPQSTVQTLVKRTLTDLSHNLAGDTRITVPQLIIPGLNIPLSHLYPIIMALLLCTGVHELGHAITASFEDIPLTRWGYNLFALIPAAFVELVPPRDQLSSSRLRIASSGVFHNFATIAILFLLSSFDIRQHFFPIIGYKALENGVKVVGFAENSPLAQYISPGATIVKLDDVRMEGYPGFTTSELWSDILLRSPNEDQEVTGWCLQSSLFHARFGNCCYLESTLVNTNETCFTSSDQTENGCIDPLPMLENSTWPRCDSNFDCRNDGLCVQPHPSVSLTRITFKHPNEERLQTIVWNGEKREVWQQIIIDNFESQISFLPDSLPYWVTLFIEYINTVSLSLILFNLLPIRILDGGEVFLAFVDLVSPKQRATEHFDLESGGISRTNRIWTGHAKNILLFLERTTIIILSCLTIDGLFSS